MTILSLVLSVLCLCLVGVLGYALQRISEANDRINDEVGLTKTRLEQLASNVCGPNEQRSRANHVELVRIDRFLAGLKTPKARRR